MRFLYFLLLLSIGCTSNMTVEESSTVRVRLGADLNYINPLLSGSSYARQVEQLIFLPLCQFNPVSLELEPVLATSLPAVKKLEEERVAYRFQIRAEAKWTDGRPVTAADYHFTFKMIFNPALRTDGYRAYLSFVDSIVVDPANLRQVTVFTNKSYHLASTVLSNIEIFPAHVYDPNEVLKNYDVKKLRIIALGKTDPKHANAMTELTVLARNFEQKTSIASPELIGAGPYQLDTWEEKEHVILHKKKDYWGEEIKDPPPSLIGNSDILNFKIIPDRQTAFQLLKSGEIDIMNETPPASFQEVRTGQTKGLQSANPPQFLYYYIAMNPDRPALANADLRRAMSKSFDNQQWIEKQLFNLATPVTNPISPLKSYYHPDLKTHSYQPEKVRELFGKNGFNDNNGDGILEGKEEQPLQLQFAFSVNNPTAKTMATFFAERAKAAGIEIIPDPMDFTKLRSSYASGDYDLVLLASGAPPADYDPQQSWHTNSWGRGNLVRFGNQQTDAIIETIVGSLDAEERKKHYLLLQEEIYKACPFIFLYSPLQTVAAREDLQFEKAKVWPGFVINSLRRFSSFGN